MWQWTWQRQANRESNNSRAGGWKEKIIRVNILVFKIIQFRVRLKLKAKRKKKQEAARVRVSHGSKISSGMGEKSDYCPTEGLTHNKWWARQSHWLPEFTMRSSEIVLGSLMGWWAKTGNGEGKVQIIKLTWQGWKSCGMVTKLTSIT